jgi:hypothetical protein
MGGWSGGMVEKPEERVKDVQGEEAGPGGASSACGESCSPAGISLQYGMTDILRATLALYRQALSQTARSFARGWIVAVALVLFAVAMLMAGVVAAPFGLLGGFLLGAVNALLVGATLSLIEQTLAGSRRLGLREVGASVGRYFWEVIGVGFVLWIPIMVLERGLAANPYGPAIGAMVFFLLFILLNPAPEVIYQVRPGSPLEVIRHSYEFVIENWIEWFLPLALVVAPFGVSFFLRVSGRLGRGAGLEFFELLTLPYALLTHWLTLLGLSGGAASTLVVLLTPVATALMLIFRGHLFAALHGSTRRKRLYQARFS